MVWWHPIFEQVQADREYGAGSPATFEHSRRDDPELTSRCIAWEPISVKGFRNAVNVFEIPWREGEPEATTGPDAEPLVTRA